MVEWIYSLFSRNSRILITSEMAILRSYFEVHLWIMLIWQPHVGITLIAILLDTHVNDYVTCFLRTEVVTGVTEL